MDSRKIVFKETSVVAIGQAICCAAMVGIFALLEKYNTSVLIGAIAGCVIATLNFFFMAVAVSLAADKAEAQNVKGGEALVRISYFVRMIVLFVVLYALVKSGVCNVIALAVPLLFVRVTLTVTEFFKRKPGEKAE